MAALAAHLVTSHGGGDVTYSPMAALAAHLVTSHGGGDVMFSPMAAQAGKTIFFPFNTLVM